MRQWKTMGLWLLLSSAILTAGCGTKVEPHIITQLQIVKPEVPDQILRCKNKPEPPTKPYTQRDVAIYLASMELVADDCKGNLAAVRKELYAFTRSAEKFNAAQIKKTQADIEAARSVVISK